MTRKMSEEAVGVREVAGGAEGDDLAGGVGVEEGAGNGEVGLDLLHLGHGGALFQEEERSLARFHKKFSRSTDRG